MHARDPRYDGNDFFALLLKELQVIPENLERKPAFGASKGLADVVFDRLGEVPDRARILFYRAIHGGDQFLFVFMKYRAPLVVRLQVDEILRVAESPSVGSVVGPADLRHNLAHFRERREHIALVGREVFSLRKTCAIRQSAARPDSTFVQMRQELRSNNTAKTQIDGSSQCG